MNRTDLLDERAYIYWSPSYPPQQAIISSHGGYVFERMPFTTPVLLRYYQGHGQLAHGSQLEDILNLIATADGALLPQSPRPREFPAGSLSRDYVLTKFQTEAGESYDDIETYVQKYNDIIAVLGLHPQARIPYLMRFSTRLRRLLFAIPTGSVGHLAIVTVRNRPTKAAVHLSDLVAAICAAAPRIHTIHCSFCLA